MSAEARYFRVGVFVFTGLLSVVVMAVVFGGLNLFEEKIYFETYFDEAVTGLEVGSPVMLRGVPIGAVAGISLADELYTDVPDPDHRLRDLVVVRMEATARGLREGPISMAERRERLERDIERGLRLRLSQSGITGVAFVQADILDPEQFPPMEIFWEPRELYVPSAPSTIATITSAAERIAKRLDEADIPGLIENLDGLIENVDQAVQALDVGTVQEQAVALLADLQRTSQQLRRDVRGAEVPAIGESTRAALDELNATLVRTRRLVEGGGYDLELTLENLRVSTENLRELTDTLRSQPSLLIRGEAPQPSPPQPEPQP